MAALLFGAPLALPKGFRVSRHGERGFDSPWPEESTSKAIQSPPNRNVNLATYNTSCATCASLGSSFATATRIRTPASGLCADWHTGNDDMYMGQCHNGDNQKFYMEPLAAPHAGQRFFSRYGTHCLDWHMENDNLYWGGCHDGSNQKFFIENAAKAEAATSAARIMSKYKSNKCVNLAYGTSLIMSDCHDGNNQKFYFDA